MSLFFCFPSFSAIRGPRLDALEHTLYRFPADNYFAAYHIAQIVFQIVTIWSIGDIFFYVITLSGLYVRLANHSVIADLLVRIIMLCPILILVFGS